LFEPRFLIWEQHSSPARIGLVKTMVFTHLPSSLFLIAVPFVPSTRWAVLLFLLREALVEMDVPTRQSYVAAVVRANERTFAEWSNQPHEKFLVGGGIVHCRFPDADCVLRSPAGRRSLKIIYDLLLYRAFPACGATRGKTGVVIIGDEKSPECSCTPDSI